VDGVSQRRLHNAEVLGALGHVLSTSHFQKILDMGQFHDKLQFIKLFYSFNINNLLDDVNMYFYHLLRNKMPACAGMTSMN
jgi:hypothetical protein